MSREETLEKTELALKKVPANRNSLFQMRHFIIGSQPTWQSKMWQALFELRKNKESIDSLNFESQEMRDNLDLLRIDLQEYEEKDAVVDIYEKKRKEIKFKQLKRKEDNLVKSINNIEQRIAYLIEECSFYVNIFEEINKEHPLVDYDDETAQTEYWNAKLKEELDLRMLLQQPLDIELIKTTLSLPDEATSKKQVLGILAVVQRQLIEEQKKKALQEQKKIHLDNNENKPNIRLTD